MFSLGNVFSTESEFFLFSRRSKLDTFVSIGVYYKGDIDNVPSNGGDQTGGVGSVFKEIGVVEIELDMGRRSNTNIQGVINFHSVKTNDLITSN